MALPSLDQLRILGILSLCATAACAGSETDTSGSVKPDVDTSADRRMKRDADGDGYARGRDCDDTRASVNPAATETCATTYDDDCDGVTNERNAVSCTTFYLDADNDGFGDGSDSACYCSSSGSYDSRDASDCDDSSASVNTSAVEIPGDGIDQDCDGTDAVDPGGDPDPDPDPDPGTGDAPLFGFWGLNGYLSASGLADVESRMGMSVVQLACGSPSYCVNTVLPMFRAAGVHVTFRMTGSHSLYTTSGSFDLTKWKSQLAAWEGYDVQEFIDDGTFVGHMILDDISNFSGTDATAADLDEMARYSKELFPGLMTFVRERCNRVPTPSGGGGYTYVDACVNQYRARDGEIHSYVSEQRAEAAALNLNIINGLNLPDGGDGSSGQPGWRSDVPSGGPFYAMSAAEITEYGEALAAMPEMGMFLSWEYDGEEEWSDGTIGADYLDQPDIQAALSDLAEVVKSHEPVTLLKP